MELEGDRREMVNLGSGQDASWHRAYRADDGTLVVEWEEYRDSAPYDHCDSLIFNNEQEFLLRAALGDHEASKSTTAILAERFQSYWAVRAFADSNAVIYEYRVDFWP
jgi:hypothetical protein